MKIATIKIDWKKREAWVTAWQEETTALIFEPSKDEMEITLTKSAS